MRLNIIFAASSDITHPDPESIWRSIITANCPQAATMRVGREGNEDKSSASFSHRGGHGTAAQRGMALHSIILLRRRSAYSSTSLPVQLQSILNYRLLSQSKGIPYDFITSIYRTSRDNNLILKKRNTSLT